MYQQIKPTEVFRERELALLEEAKNRRLVLGRRLRTGRTPTKARSTIVAAVLGFLGALMVASLMLAASSSPAHASTPFVVNDPTDFFGDDLNPGDGVCDVNLSPTAEECTLRAAIQEANASDGADTIEFKIPGTGVQTISPRSPLPTITEQVTIDGYTQLGSSPNTLAKGTNAKLMIELNGSEAGAVNGLELDASNSVVRGLVINNFDSKGISVEGDGNKIEGNLIGTDPSGTIDQGNGLFGVDIDSGTNNTVGGASPEVRNLISGNDFIGVFISARSAGSEVLGNYIGTDRGGTGDLGNSGAGVTIHGAAKNTIGDGTARGANTIAFNANDGVVIFNSSDPNDANANTVSRNSIFSNAGLGINLKGGVEDSVGRTANDPGDVDSGPNGLQNKPVITSAKTGSAATTIKCKLNSAGNVPYIVQFFSNPKGNEGKKVIGQKTVATDASGTATFTFKPKKKVAVGRTITATATRDFFSIPTDTSEFSAPKKVVAS